MTSPCWLFENLDCSREKFLLLPFSTWLAEKESMLQDRRDSRQGTNWPRIPNRPFTRKGRLMTEFHKFLHERWLQGGISRNNLAHTSTYFANFWGFVNSLFWKCNTFSNLTRCICLCSMGSWCTLEWPGYPYALVIAREIKVGRGICVMSCYLTTKIPSVLLVAVVWLQHTQYPRFRRGTFDHEVTTSPNKRGRVRVWRFMRMHVSIPMLLKCTCYAMHAQKPHFKFKSQGLSKTEKTSSGFRNRLDLWLTWNYRAQNLIDHNLA
jgi:hypothetical protein